MSLSSSSRKQSSAGRHHKVFVWFGKGKSVKRILQLSALLIILAHLPLLFVSTRVVFVNLEDAASAAITSTRTSLSPSLKNQPLSNNSTKSPVEPIWQCSDAPESRTGNKLVFVHIFKTAGSSVRNFLRAYSLACHAGYGTIVSCTNVDPNSLLQQQQEWKRCKLKEAMDQRGMHYRGSRKIKNDMAQNHLDIVAGHLRLGTLDHLRDEHDTPINIRYVSFFRNAAYRFVSGKVYTKRRELELKNLTKQDVIRNIQKHVDNDMSKGRYFSKYDNYLLTPLQRQFVSSSRNSTSMEIKTGLMMKNLVKYNVLVGMVERMPESMQLLSHILGKRVSSSALKQNERANSNKSPISTSSILTELEQDDPGFFQKLMEYVKYEQEITDFAMDLHMKQFNAMQHEQQMRRL